ncbi:MAG TPA: HDIG domain-containing protein [Tepidisphaeraceae bacterium]|jgi:putative nucleotidyltransferase with HDIG domain|nr:HDIG domain-containing protein [Tepidisphaeraceae bacterium]
MMLDRNSAWAIVCEHVKDRGLRRHMQAVEAAMRFYAGQLGGDPDQWGLTGLLHDFDWEIHPTLMDHPAKGAPILRDRGVDEEIITAILSHNEHATNVKPATPLHHALLACDEITGLIIATALVRPTKDIRQVEVKSVKNKWKQPSFAAGVHRPQVESATQQFSQHCFDGKLDLWQHVGNVLDAMKLVASDLDLDGRLAASTPPPPQV